MLPHKKRQLLEEPHIEENTKKGSDASLKKTKSFMVWRNTKSFAIAEYFLLSTKI